MELVRRLRAWSYSRQCLGRPAPTLEEALRAVVAVYATHPTAPLALRARTRSLSASSYRRVDREGKALRIPGMRGTVFLVPRHSAARVFTAVRPTAARITRSLERHGISARDYERLAHRIMETARKPLRSGELQEAASIKGQPLGTVLRCLRYDGRLLALGGDSLHMSAHRYVATSAWAPEGLEAGDPSEALAWLAGEYLRAYGPSRTEDFAWWAGVGMKAAGMAIEPHDAVDVGDGLLLLAEDEAAFGRLKPSRGTVDVLPRWDPYTMGYAPDGRARFVDPDVRDRVYTPIGVGFPGDGNPVVLVDGQAAATWTYTPKGGAVVQLFDTVGPSLRRKIDEKLHGLVRFLNQ